MDFNENFILGCSAMDLVSDRVLQPDTLQQQ